MRAHHSTPASHHRALGAYPYQGSPLVDQAYAALSASEQALVSAKPENALVAVQDAPPEVRWRTAEFQEAAAVAHLMASGWTKVNEARYDGDYNHLVVKGRNNSGLEVTRLTPCEFHPVLGQFPDGGYIRMTVACTREPDVLKKDNSRAGATPAHNAAGSHLKPGDATFDQGITEAAVERAADILLQKQPADVLRELISYDGLDSTIARMARLWNSTVEASELVVTDLLKTPPAQG